MLVSMLIWEFTSAPDWVQLMKEGVPGAYLWQHQLTSMYNTRGTKNKKCNETNNGTRSSYLDHCLLSSITLLSSALDPSRKISCALEYITRHVYQMLKTIQKLFWYSVLNWLEMTCNGSLHVAKGPVVKSKIKPSLSRSEQGLFWLNSSWLTS